MARRLGRMPRRLGRMPRRLGRMPRRLSRIEKNTEGVLFFIEVGFCKLYGFNRILDTAFISKP